MSQFYDIYDIYNKAINVLCELMMGGFIYGIDKDILINKAIEEKGVISPISLKEFIINNIERFSDDDKIRHEAIERLGW